MSLAAVLILLGAVSVESYYLPNDLRTLGLCLFFSGLSHLLECNEVLDKEGVYLLPKGAKCDIVITNEQRLLLELWSVRSGGCGMIKVLFLSYFEYPLLGIVYRRGRRGGAPLFPLENRRLRRAVHPPRRQPRGRGGARHLLHPQIFW